MQPQRGRGGQPIRRKGSAVVSGIVWLRLALVPLWHSIWKFLAHLITRKGEIERGLSRGPFTPTMQKEVSGSIQRSKQLHVLTASLFLRREEFDVTRVTTQIVDLKKMHMGGQFRTLVLPNLQRCLSNVLHTNRLLNYTLMLRYTAYDSHDPKHEHMLERLWSDLRPGVERQGGRFTSEWGQIGFQGKDPATDFRDMGLLGLHQLAYFARTRPGPARRIVDSADLPYKGFPFAITGINLTSAVLDLLDHRVLADTFAEDTTRSMEQFNDVYCDVYTMFAQWWDLAPPKDIMGFSAIYARFRTALTAYITQHGVVPPLAWVDKAHGQ